VPVEIRYPLSGEAVLHSDRVATIVFVLFGAEVVGRTKRAWAHGGLDIYGKSDIFGEVEEN
jgi:hypothetical protein